MREKAKLILASSGKSLLENLPMILGFGIILFPERPLSNLTFAFGLFLAGFTGIIIAVRKEASFSLGSIRGKWAVVQGICFTLLLWVSALYIILR